MSAAAPLALSLTATPLTLVASPARLIFAPPSDSVNACSRALPALTEMVGVRSTPMVKLVSRTFVVPARSCRPPLCVMVPAAVAGLMLPPVIGEDRPLVPALAGAMGETETPRPCEGLGRPGVELQCGRAAGELDGGGAGRRGDGERHQGADGRGAERAAESGHALSSERRPAPG